MAANIDQPWALIYIYRLVLFDAFSLSRVKTNKQKNKQLTSFTFVSPFTSHIEKQKGLIHFRPGIFL